MGEVAQRAGGGEAAGKVDRISRILIVTDAWTPQVNGVARTMQRIVEGLAALGVETPMITPSDYPTLPMPSYPEIRLALTLPGSVGRRIDAAGADHVHIVTEGPLGQMARRHCLKKNIPFTTSYHTRFPEYVRARVPLPESWLYGIVRNFHNAGGGTLVATRSMTRELAARGFTRLRPWSRGVDSKLFDPARRKPLDLSAPVFLNVGRVAVEKNLPAFLDLDLPGTKVIVGDGPDLPKLKRRYPDAVFLGARTGVDLAEVYASADIFVFPSRTDTFGNVLLEALASGLPVAAYPVTGPVDLIDSGVDGVLDDDLGAAALAALACDRGAARRKALAHSWEECTRQFLAHAAGAHEADAASPVGSSPAHVRLGAP